MSTETQIQQAVQNMRSMPHLEAIRDITELFKLDVENGLSSEGKLPFRAVVMNMEHGKPFEQILAYLRLHPSLADADIILANELDYGRSRTENRNTTRLLAEALGLNYAYGVEFLTAHAWQNGNREGREGNAILSRFPLNRTKLLHLPIEFEWFHREDDCRLGTRIAILAEIMLQDRPVGIVCTHLENRTTPEKRAHQFRWLLEQVEAFFPDMPVLIGGDMNTNTVDGDAADAYDVYLGDEAEQARRSAIIPDLEPLMRTAEAFGYSYRDCNEMVKYTRRKPMPDGSVIRMNLDWFFQKGFACTEAERVETIFDHTALIGKPARYAHFDGTELADHDAVAFTVALPEETA